MRIAMIGDEDRLHSQRLNGFERLRNRIIHLMARFGEPDSISRHGDYSVHGDYWGYPQVKVSIQNLRLLRPDIVKRLQAIVAEFPGWEIVYTVAVRDHYCDWPDMGCTFVLMKSSIRCNGSICPRNFRS
jgi:hypothetical protein